jgi:hypothetical protein
VAGKRRTPPPPRRVQAPQTRRDPRKPIDRRMVLLVVGAIVLAAAIAVGAFFLVRATGGSVDVAEAMREAGCTYRQVPTVGRTHIGDADAMPEAWNTFPPTSGPHFGVPAIFGEYEEPLQLARALHNLEHGGVAVNYGDDVPETEVEALRRFYRSDPTGMLLAPLPRLGDKITLTAWTAPVEGEEGTPRGHIAECTRYDEKAFEAFRDELRFKGPERLPPEALEPGS